MDAEAILAPHLPRLRIKQETLRRQRTRQGVAFFLANRHVQLWMAGLSPNADYDAVCTALGHERQRGAAGHWSHSRDREFGLYQAAVALRYERMFLKRG